MLARALRESSRQIILLWLSIWNKSSIRSELPTLTLTSTGQDDDARRAQSDNDIDTVRRTTKAVTRASPFLSLRSATGIHDEVPQTSCSPISRTHRGLTDRADAGTTPASAASSTPPPCQEYAQVRSVGFASPGFTGGGCHSLLTWPIPHPRERVYKTGLCRGLMKDF